MDKILDKEREKEEIELIFNAYDDEAVGEIAMETIREELEDQGLNFFEELPFQDRESINFEEFQTLFETDKGDLLKRAFQGRLIVPDFDVFREKVERIYKIVETIDEGANADYIPQLDEVPSDLFAIAACTVDGQQVAVGDYDYDVCIQSWEKPIAYGIALEEHGIDYVHKHVGREPSGAPFNKNFLNQKGLPHNPCINSGAIMTASLVGQKLPLYKRFEYVKKFWEGLSGGGKIGFQNSTYLSEKDTASRNFCLGHMMMNSKAFPKGTELEETLKFYFQLCSLEIKSKDMAIVAATLANGGECPITHQRIFKEETVNHVLSIMHSCGMYDYSGEWGYSVGIPAKSGVGGLIYLVVPKVMGICTFCPRLDERGNSVRGIEVSKLLLKEFTMHRYDLLKGVVTPFSYKKSLLQSINEQKNKFTIDVLNSVDYDDLYYLQSLIELAKEGNFDINNIKDYDGVTPAHLCCSHGNEEILLYLIKLEADFESVRDKWGFTPVQRAKEAGSDNVIKLLDRIFSSHTA